VILCHVVQRCLLFASYDVNIPVTSGFAVLSIPDASREVFRQHLNSFNDWALVGMFLLTAEILKFIHN